MTWFQQALQTEAPLPVPETVSDDVDDDLEEDIEFAEQEDTTQDASHEGSPEASPEQVAEALRATIRRARATQIQEEAEAHTPDGDAPVEETDPVDADAPRDDFEAELDAALDGVTTDDGAALEASAPEQTEPVQTEPEVAPHEDLPEPEDTQPTQDDAVYYEPTEDAEPEDTPEPVAQRRRTIDPTVATILQEEAALEVERRAEETLESQPDLGLDETQDDAAKRAQQAKERMARMRGVSPEEMDQPPEPIPANSRRDLLPDIEEINSTLRATEDRKPEEQPDGRPTLNQRRAGGRRIGFALALLLVAFGALVYSDPALISDNFAGLEKWVAAYVNFIDTMRIRLDSQVTKLMLWLDSLSAGA
nr:hypothetical protein [Cognatishimia maritima]